MEQFWMCYVEGKTGSTVKHESNTSAYKEAERLARKERRKVFVLEATDYCEVHAPVTWSKLTTQYLLVSD